MATSFCTAKRAFKSGWRRKNNEYLRIVMVGKTGAGKSATGNTILGRKFFESKLSATSMTVDCSKGRAEVDGQKVAVIDTPGLFDTRFDEDETYQHLSQCISFASPGPHVFLVVIRLVDRYTEEEKRTVQRIQELFGEAADKYSMVLFTHGDQLEDTTIEEFLDGSSELQELVARCNGQYHVFNNKVKDRSQVTELLQKIREICRKNTGGFYTNKMFQQAERAVEEKKQLILKENEEQRQKEMEELEKKYEEKYRQEMKKLDKKLQIEREKQRKEREERRMDMQELKLELKRERDDREAEVRRVMKEKEREMYKERKRERDGREAEVRRVREEKEREMYMERMRERDEREAEVRRVREEKEREIENMRMQFFEQQNRKLREEKARLQERHENEAREKAEKSNPFNKIVNGCRKVGEGVRDVFKGFCSWFS